jgi:hypothetical protein
LAARRCGIFHGNTDLLILWKIQGLAAKFNVLVALRQSDRTMLV